MSDEEPRRSEGDLENVPDRSDRVFQKGEFWYFHTREGAQIGPFDSKELALKGTNDYVGFAEEAEQTTLDSISNSDKE